MADPTSIENLLRAEIAAFKVAPLSFIAAIICFVFILWLVLYFLFKSRLESKDEQIKTKEEQGKIKDDTISFLKLKLEGESPLLEKIFEPTTETAIGISDIATEVNGPTIKQYEQQNPVDTLAELRSEGIHKILNAPIKNDDDWEKLLEYQKDWWGRVEAVLRENFTKADQFNFTRLGVIPLLQFPHTYNDGHAKMLREFAIQDERLREIIDRNITRPNRES